MSALKILIMIYPLLRGKILRLNRVNNLLVGLYIYILYKYKMNLFNDKIIMNLKDDVGGYQAFFIDIPGIRVCFNDDGEFYTDIKTCYTNCNSELYYTTILRSSTILKSNRFKTIIYCLRKLFRTEGFENKLVVLLMSFSSFIKQKYSYNDTIELKYLDFLEFIDSLKNK